VSGHEIFEHKLEFEVLPLIIIDLIASGANQNNCDQSLDENRNNACGRTCTHISSDQSGIKEFLRDRFTVHHIIRLTALFGHVRYT
jgi:hypothetical protein